MDFAMFQNMIDNSKREEGVVARFYDRPIKSSEIGNNGLPMFIDKTFVEIRVKDNADVFNQPASEEYIRRFPVEYNRYLLEKKQITEGTPLNMFAFLTAAQFETCKSRGIFTVEVLAGIEDERAKALNLEQEKALAVKFMEGAKGNKAIAEFAKKEKEYKAKIKKLEEEIKALKATKDE
jgi:hypothetical protein